MILIAIFLLECESFCLVENCIKCADSDASRCFFCEKGFRNHFDGSCKKEKKIELYKSNQLNCVKYSREFECLECHSSSILVNGECQSNTIRSMPIVSSPTQPSLRQLLCEDPTQQCDCSTFSACQYCDNYQCLLCNPGYAIDGQGNCLQCPTGCTDCFYHFCFSCLDYYILTPFGSCEPCSPPCVMSCSDKHCLSCVNYHSCSICKEGYYYSPTLSIFCIPCSEGCLECTGAGDCSRCHYNYTLEYSSACVRIPLFNSNCKMPKCLACDWKGICTKCDVGYFLDTVNNMCVTCSGFCKFCTDLFMCNECNYGFLLINGSCVERIAIIRHASLESIVVTMAIILIL